MTTAISPTIAELVQQARRGRSYRHLSREAEGAGYPITRQLIQTLGTGLPIDEFPRPRTIRGLAAALGVTEDAVIRAVAKTLGFDMSAETADGALRQANTALQRQLDAVRRVMT